MDTGGDNSGPGGTDVKWEPWSGSVPGDLARGGGLPTAVALVTKQENDNQGRETLRINPGGGRHFLLYEEDQTLRFPYIDATSGLPAVPVEVTVWDAAHRAVESYAVAASAATASGGVPTGVSATQGDYVAWVRNHHDPLTGELTQVDRYHLIPDGGGVGAVGTNFSSTSFLHEGMGRNGARIEYVAASQYQVTVALYDALERPVEIRRGVTATPPDDYDDLDDALPYTPTDFAGYAAIAKTVYDGGGVGDGYVTKSSRYFGTGTYDFTGTNFYHNFRGHRRLAAPFYMNGSTETALTPQTVIDYDWLERPIATAQYASALSGATVVADVDYAATIDTDRHDLTKTAYDDVGRVYQIQQYPGPEDTNHVLTNNYYDRNDRLVCRISTARCSSAADKGSTG